MYLRLSLKKFWLLFFPKNVDTCYLTYSKPSHIRVCRCPHMCIFCCELLDTTKHIDYTSITPTNPIGVSHARRY